MQEPLFIEFANACLKAIHPEEAAQEVTDEQIVQKLQEKISDGCWIHEIQIMTVKSDSTWYFLKTVQKNYWTKPW